MAEPGETISPVTVRPPGQPMVLAASVLVAIGALYVGAGIFVPLVLAVLVAFALAPVVRLLHRLKLPHVVAVIIAVAGAAMVIGFIGFLIITQFARLAAEIPQYQQIVGSKLRALQQSTGGGGAFTRIEEALQSLGARLGDGTSTSDPSIVQPQPVTIVNPQNPLSYVQGFLGSLLGPLATAAIVTVFVVFLLLQRGDFRDRFLKLVSRGDLRTSTMAMNDAAKRVSRYLLVQFMVNFTYGVIFGTGMFLIGVPNAVLWGLFAGLFRYIPFVGTLIAATIPFALSFAIDPGWGMLAASVILFVSLELVTTNLIEPRLYGSSTGLSALAVIVAAMFWATLWGPIGLILATPMTVCLVVLGRYVPQLQFLEVLLGSEPVLVREEQLYQRLLSDNIEEAIDLAETSIATSSARAFYDEVALPALRLAEADRARSLTDVATRRKVVEGMSAVIQEIEHLTPEQSSDDEEDVAAEPLRVVCIGGRTELDGAAAEMVAQVMLRAGIETRMLPPVALRQEAIGQIDLAGVDVVCLAYLDPYPRTYARFVARRIRRRAPNVKIMICLLNTAPGTNLDEVRSRFEGDSLAFTIATIETEILAIAKERVPEAVSPVEGETEKAEWLDRLRHVAGDHKSLDQFTADVATALNAQLAMVSIDEEGESLAALAARHASEKLPPTVASLAAEVMEAGDLLVIEEVSADKAHASDPFLLENSMEFYAGAPLRAPWGETVGVLSILDPEPRKFSKEDRAALKEKADAFVARLDDAEQASDRSATALAPA